MLQPLPPWDLLYDALHFTAKANPQQSKKTWPVGTALVPHEARKCQPDIFPSEAHALLAFTGQETMRLHLPVVAPCRAVVTNVLDTIGEALRVCTPAARSQQAVPISSALHENGQLCWGRSSRSNPNVSVPLCRYGANCDALCLDHAPSCLPVYMTPAEQDTFDEEGTVPPMALFCLLCIRRDAQAMYMMHTMAPVNSQVDLGRPTLVVPPFQNLVDVPGGYKREYIGVPATERWACNISIVGVCSNLKVAYDPHRSNWYINQNNLLFGHSLN